MKMIFLGIGTNLGNRENNLKETLTCIEKYIGHIAGSSSVYETEPWGFASDYKFLNMAIKVRTRLSPERLFENILMIEGYMGRVRGEKQYSSRVIDIDILLFGDMVIDEENLKIPHPLMHERRFVLVPLCEIASELIHPVLKKSFGSLLQSCTDNNIVRRYEL